MNVTDEIVPVYPNCLNWPPHVSSSSGQSALSEFPGILVSSLEQYEESNPPQFDEVSPILHQYPLVELDSQNFLETLLRHAIHPVGVDSVVWAKVPGIPMMEFM